MSKQGLKQRFPALKSRDFTLFWSAQFVSNAGTQMQVVALSWHIYLLTGSAFALGLVGLFRFIPILIFSLIGGSVADAHNRKKILFVTQFVMIVLSLTLAITSFAGSINIFLIYIVTLLAATSISFDTPARQAFIPGLVEKKYLTSAMSLSSIAIQIARILGPTLAGLLIAHTNLGVIYGINALTFMTVMISLFFIKKSGVVEGIISPVSIKSILEGLSYVRHKTIIWSTMLLDFFSTFFASATALLPIFAKDILNAGPIELGLLYAAPSIGALMAGIFIAHKHNLGKQGYVLLSAVSVYAIGTIIFGLSKIFIFSFLALVIVGVGDSISTIIRNVIRQIETPDYIRGRISSVNMIFFMGGPELGEFEAGTLASFIGAPTAVVIGGIGTLIATIGMGIGVPPLRNYDKHKDIEDVLQGKK